MIQSKAKIHYANITPSVLKSFLRKRKVVTTIDDNRTFYCRCLMHEIKKKPETAFPPRLSQRRSPSSIDPPSPPPSPPLTFSAIELIQVHFLRLSFSLFPLLLRVTKRRSLDFVSDYVRFILPHDTSGQDFGQNIAGRFQTKRKKKKCQDNNAK